MFASEWVSGNRHGACSWKHTVCKEGQDMLAWRHADRSVCEEAGSRSHGAPCQERRCSSTQLPGEGGAGLGFWPQRSSEDGLFVGLDTNRAAPCRRYHSSDVRPTDPINLHSEPAWLMASNQLLWSLREASGKTRGKGAGEGTFCSVPHERCLLGSHSGDDGRGDALGSPGLSG